MIKFDDGAVLYSESVYFFREGDVARYELYGMRNEDMGIYQAKLVDSITINFGTIRFEGDGNRDRYSSFMHSGSLYHFSPDKLDLVLGTNLPDLLRHKNNMQIEYGGQELRGWVNEN